jgi:hypothetical protein
MKKWMLLPLVCLTACEPAVRDSYAELRYSGPTVVFSANTWTKLLLEGTAVGRGISASPVGEISIDEPGDYFATVTLQTSCSSSDVTSTGARMTYGDTVVGLSSAFGSPSSGGTPTTYVLGFNASGATSIHYNLAWGFSSSSSSTTCELISPAVIAGETLPSIVAVIERME